jgi:hypothetical protein
VGLIVVSVLLYMLLCLTLINKDDIAQWNKDR